MRELPLFGGNGRAPRRTTGQPPWRLLTDWTTAAGLDGSGLLALVAGGRAAEGIHLATLGYETIVIHPDDAAAEAAEQAAHVHHVAADPADLPAEWILRFDLVLAVDVAPPVEVLAAQGILVALTAAAVETPDGLVEVDHEWGADPDESGTERHRTVLARL